MTIFWLFVWLCSGTPQIGSWNGWMIALVVCAGLDILGVIEKRNR